jgi:phage tail tape-measure protein
MGLGLNLGGGLSGAATGASIGSVVPGIGTVAGAIGGGILGLFSGGGGSRKDQEKLMDRAWGYEKEGMALQYGYNEQAAQNTQERNKEMWDYTNFENQRKHLENAKLSVGLMYGNGLVL